MNVVPDAIWLVPAAIEELFDVLGSQMSPPDSLCDAQAASCEPLTAAWNASKVNSSAQKVKWWSQTAQSSKQRADCSMENAEDNGIFVALSVVKVAPQARPKTT